jgi:hypothetical protein
MNRRRAGSILALALLGSLCFRSGPTPSRVAREFPPVNHPRITGVLLPWVARCCERFLADRAIRPAWHPPAQ